MNCRNEATAVQNDENIKIMNTLKMTEVQKENFLTDLKNVYINNGEGVLRTRKIKIYICEEYRELNISIDGILVVCIMFSKDCKISKILSFQDAFILQHDIIKEVQKFK